MASTRSKNRGAPRPKDAAGRFAKAGKGGVSTADTPPAAPDLADGRYQAPEPTVAVLDALMGQLGSVSAALANLTERLARLESGTRPAGDEPAPAAPDPQPEQPPPLVGGRARYRMTVALAMKSNTKVHLPGLSTRPAWQGKSDEDRTFLWALGKGAVDRYAHFVKGEYVTDDPAEMAELDRLIRAGKLAARRARDPRLWECPACRFETDDAEEARQHVAAFHPGADRPLEDALSAPSVPREQYRVDVETMKEGLG